MDEEIKDIRALREQLRAEYDQKIWDEARAKFKPRKLKDVPLEDLRDWMQKLSDNMRDDHPEMTFSEWYLYCMRNEIYIRYQLSYTDDSWHLYNDIRNELESKESWHAAHPYPPLTYKEISQYTMARREYPDIASEIEFLHKAVDALEPIDRMIAEGTDNMTDEEVDDVAHEVYPLWRNMHYWLAAEDLLQQLLTYRKYLIKYRLKDTLATKKRIKDAMHDLYLQLREIASDKRMSLLDED